MTKEANASRPDQLFQAIFLGTTQKVTTSGTTAQSSAFGTSTTLIRVIATQDCFIVTGTSPTAVADGTCALLPAGIPEYFGVNSGDKIAAIQSSAGGSLYITEGA